MMTLTNDEKLESVFQFIEKTKKEQKKERWILRGLILGLFCGVILFMVVALS